MRGGLLRLRPELIENFIGSLEIVFQDAGKRGPQRLLVGFLSGFNQQPLQNRFAMGAGETADCAHVEPRYVGSKRIFHSIILRPRDNQSSFAAA